MQGWLYSFEQYYHSVVRDILRHVFRSLAQDSNLRFVWSEVSFFRWFYEDEQRKGNLTVVQTIQQIVRSGRFEVPAVLWFFLPRSYLLCLLCAQFVGGGEVMPDEAVADLNMLLDNIKLGHQWLLSTFGVRPRIAWQIDAFGALVVVAACSLSVCVFRPQPGCCTVVR